MPTARHSYKAKYLAALEAARLPIGENVAPPLYEQEIRRLKTKMNWIADACLAVAMETNRLVDVANDSAHVGRLSFEPMQPIAPTESPWEANMASVLATITLAKDRIGMLAAAYDEEAAKLKVNARADADAAKQFAELRKLMPMTGPMRPLRRDGWSDLRVADKRVRFEELAPIDGLPRFKAHLETTSGTTTTADPPARLPEAAERGHARSLSDSRADEGVCEATESLKEYAASVAAQGRRNEARPPRHLTEHSRGSVSELREENRRTHLVNTLARPVKRHLARRQREHEVYRPDGTAAAPPPIRPLPRPSMESIPRFASRVPQPPAPLAIRRPVMRDNREPAPAEEDILAAYATDPED